MPELHCWVSVCSKVQMMSTWSSWCHCHSHHLLLHQNPEWFTSLLLNYSGCPGQEAIKRVLLLLLDRIGHTTYVDAVYCYRPSTVVCRPVSQSVSQSVTLVSPAKTAEPIKMLFGLRTWVGPGNHVLDWGPDSPMEMGNFEGKRRPVVKYRVTLRSSVWKLLNRSWFCLDCGLGLAQGIMNKMGVQIPHEKGNLGEKGRPL